MKTAIRNAMGAFAVMIFIGWYSGLDMLSRGNEQSVVAMIGVMMAFGAFIMSVPTEILFRSKK